VLAVMQRRVGVMVVRVVPVVNFAVMLLHAGVAVLGQMIGVVMSIVPPIVRHRPVNVGMTIRQQ